MQKTNLNVEVSTIVEDSKISKAMENTEFTEKVLEAKTKEEVKRLFEEQNITIDEEELQELSSLIRKMSELPPEMSDEELHEVSGGNFGTAAVGIGGAIAGAIAGGAIVGGGALYGMYKSFKAGMKYSDKWWHKVTDATRSGR